MLWQVHKKILEDAGNKTLIRNFQKYEKKTIVFFHAGKCINKKQIKESTSKSCDE